MQMSGGHLLAAGLDGGNTIIFFQNGKKMQIKSLSLRKQISHKYQPTQVCF